jgi:phosphoribosylformylglycinamidine cyclo-ligase
LLKVHKSYLPIIREIRDLNGINGFSHITGGGIIGNTKRILPEGLQLEIDWDAWQRPPIFKLIQDLGNVPEDDMRATFNLGIGLVAVVSPDKAGDIREKAFNMGEEVIEIGRIN